MDQPDYNYQPGIVFKIKDASAIAGDNEKEITACFRHRMNGQWKKLFAAYPDLLIKRLFCTLQPAEIAPLVEKAKQLDAGYRDPELLSYFILSCHSTGIARSALVHLQKMEEIETAYLRGKITGATGAVKKNWLTAGKAT